MVYHIYCDKSRQSKDRCIILGAIDFQKNGYNLLTGTRKSKKELTKYIAEQAGRKNLIETSPYQVSQGD